MASIIVRVLSPYLSKVPRTRPSARNCAGSHAVGGLRLGGRGIEARRLNEVGRMDKHVVNGLLSYLL